MVEPEDKNDIELKYYVEIVQYFDVEDDPDNREIFRDINLIDLMNELEQDSETKEFVKNSIVIMNVLIDKEAPPDTYYSIGHSQEQLSLEEQELLKSTLIEECTLP